VKESGVPRYTMRDIDSVGMRDVIERGAAVVLRRYAGSGGEFGYGLLVVILKMPPGVGHSGARRRDVFARASGDGDDRRHGAMVSLEIVEINPGELRSTTRLRCLAWRCCFRRLGKKIL